MNFKFFVTGVMMRVLTNAGYVCVADNNNNNNNNNNNGSSL